MPAALRPLRRWALRHETAAYMLMLALCWSPYLIAFYPGTVCWDLGEMVAQFFGQRPMDTWHPVFLTWVIGGCVWLGRLVGSDNLGAALYTLIQTALMAFALSGVLRLMRALRLNRAARLAAAAFFALLPIWADTRSSSARIRCIPRRCYCLPCASSASCWRERDGCPCRPDGKPPACSCGGF